MEGALLKLREKQGVFIHDEQSARLGKRGKKGDGLTSGVKDDCFGIRIEW